MIVELEKLARVHNAGWFIKIAFNSFSVLEAAFVSLAGYLTRR